MAFYPLVLTLLQLTLFFDKKLFDSYNQNGANEILLSAKWKR